MADRLRREAQQLLNPGSLIWLFVAVGMLLRLAVYLFDRPFWTDEAQLALNIVDKTLPGLMGRLDYCQAAPPFFLLVEKLLACVFGNTELVLRFLPLVAGLGSQALFALIARKALRSWAAPLSVALFAFSQPLIRYSSELKQYSTDVLAVLILLAVADSALRRGKLRWLALLAVVVPWMSYASILVVIGVVCVGIALGTARGQFKHVLKCGLVACLAGASVFGLYVITLHYLASGPCRTALMDGRAVVPPDSSICLWLVNKGSELMQFPGGFSALGAGAAALCLVVGLASLVRREPVLALCMAAPLAVALAGSSLSMYPFFGRFLLFAAPSLLLCVSEGAQWLFQSIGDRRGRAVAGVTAVALLLLPRADFIQFADDEWSWQYIDVRGVLRYVQSRRQDGDLLYVYYGAYFPVLYYCRQLGIAQDKLVIGVPGYWWNKDLRETLLTAWAKCGEAGNRPDEAVFDAYADGDFSKQWQVYERDVARLAGHSRVWALFSLCNWCGSDEEKLFLYFLDRKRRQLDFLIRPGASAYLYDSNEPERVRPQSSDLARR